MPPKLNSVLQSIGTSASRGLFEEFLRSTGISLADVSKIQRDARTSVDISNYSPGEITSWLEAHFPHSKEQVVVSWLGDGVAATMTCGTFVENFDDLWYPAMDDVAVVLRESESVGILVIDHEETLSVSDLQLP